MTEITIESFMGRWYQMFSSLIPASTYEKDLVCVGADYTIVNSTLFQVNNFGLYKSPSGPKKSMMGEANLMDESEPGKWQITLEGTSNIGEFWITHLGPLRNNFYDYCIISDSKGLNMFVLSRDPSYFKENYNDEILVILRGDGFTGISAPVITYQSPSCEY